MLEKIFCNGCGHFEDSFIEIGVPSERCTASQNRTTTHRSDKVIMKAPNNINKNNNCEWFVKRRSLWQRLTSKI